MNDQQKAKELRQQYATQVQASREAKAHAAAYTNLTSENADSAAEAVRAMVLDLSEKGYLSQLAQYVQQALVVNNKSTKKE